MAITGLLVAMAAPNLVNARKNTQRELCIHNLHQLDAAKSTWALNNGVGTDEEPFEEELAPHFRDQRVPECPVGGTYTLGHVGEPATCSLEDIGHFSANGENGDEADEVLGGGENQGQAPAEPKDPKKPKKPKKNA
jgi:hypothetical protein